MNMSDKVESISAAPVGKISMGTKLATFLKRLNRPVSKKRGNTRMLWGREFGVLKKGLDEKQVIDFVNELIARYESSPAKPVPEAGLPVETGHSRDALLDFIKARANIEDEARQEYGLAYSRLLTSLRDLVREGAGIETRLKDKTVELSEVLTRETKELEATLESAATPVRSDAVKSEAIHGMSGARAHTSGEKVIVEAAAETRVSREATEMKVNQDGSFVPLEQKGQTLFSGEVELDIMAPVDVKMVTKLFNFLQTLREVKVLHTTGSWDQGPTLTLMLEKPMPLIGLIAKIEGLNGKLAILERDEVKEGKEGLLSRRRKAAPKKIKLVLVQN